jgi:hypothetical protein
MSFEYNSTFIRPPTPPTQPRQGLSLINPNDIENTPEPVEERIPQEVLPFLLQVQEPIQQYSQEPFIKGQFLYIQNKHNRKMLINAWNAITQLELWDYMKKDKISYMLSNDSEIHRISVKMEELGYGGHSGCSFGWTMRQMQRIARLGEEHYMYETLSNIM